ncbi:hypothetical protein CesoFtcFv8_014412 [Champsocephalus esox]|uniref:Uncharacterized protein n=1 Tax=Champsocephalus esox TaxID=159716 RepID=A0AAN8BWV6_9TELE|nr:hypothetical protein CesoFtcFv8_014412 [Champsocephalus esox]
MGSASSSYRVIYLDVDGRIQKVVFSRFCSPCDIKELFCTALGVPRNTALSLVDPTGALVSIDPTMPHNTERSPYRVVPLTGGQLAASSTQSHSSSCTDPGRETCGISPEAASFKERSSQASDL